MVYFSNSILVIRLNELESGFDDQKRITFDELIKNPLLQPRSFLVSGWLSDSQFLVRNEFNDIIVSQNWLV
jgi:hypothetical protein